MDGECVFPSRLNITISNAPPPSVVYRKDYKKI